MSTPVKCAPILWRFGAKCNLSRGPPKHRKGPVPSRVYRVLCVCVCVCACVRACVCVCVCLISV